MTTKVYTTAQGRKIDLGALQAQNENVRAVGNMQINARGDRIDPNGEIIATRAQQVNRSLDRTTNTAPGPIPTSSQAVKKEDAAASRAAEQEKIEQARLQRQALREQGAAPPVDQPTAGLAAAMARAAKITEEE
jgi:hypothetical protein